MLKELKLVCPNCNNIVESKDCVIYNIFESNSFKNSNIECCVCKEKSICSPSLNHLYVRFLAHTNLYVEKKYEDKNLVS